MTINVSDLTFSDDQTPAPAPAAENATPATGGAVKTSDLTFTDENNSPQTVFDDTRGKAFQVPQGLSGKAIDQQIGVQHENRNRADYFGLIDLGKGFAKGVLQTENIPAQGLISAGETAKETGLSDSGILKDVPNPFVGGPIDSAEALGFNIAQGFSKDPQSFADVKIKSGRALAQGMKDMNARFNLEPSDANSPFSKVMFDLGTGTGNVATAVGLSVLTKDPQMMEGLAFSLFGAQSGADYYAAARKAGRDPLSATEGASGNAILNGAINAVGIRFLSKAIRLGSGFEQAAGGFVEQALQMGATSSANDIYANMDGIQKKSVLDILKDASYAAFIGGILGAPAAAIGAHFLKSGHVEALEKLGIPKEKAVELLNTMTENQLDSEVYEVLVKDLIDDELSHESQPHQDRVTALKQVGKLYDELAAKMQIDFTRELGADELKTKLDDEMARMDKVIKSKIEAVIATTEDKTVKGRANQLMKESENILKQIDSLEKKKSDLESTNAATTAIDKKIETLVHKHYDLDDELSGIVGEKSGLKDKLEKRRLADRIENLVRRAEAISKEVQGLEEGQKAIEKMQKASDIKIGTGIEKRLDDLSEQYAQIDDELAGLLLDRNTDMIPDSDLVSLKSQDMKMIADRLGKTMELVRERLQEAVDSMEAKVDKAFKKLSDQVATQARQNEKKRIHESLKLLRQIRTADIEGITIKERRMIESLQAELKSLKGPLTLDQLRDFNDRIQLIKVEGVRKLGEIMDQRRQRAKAQKDLLLRSLDVDPDAKPKPPEQYLGNETPTTKESVKIAKMRERATTLSPVRLLEMIDGVKDNGIWKTLFFHGVNTVVNSKLVKTNEGIARGQEIFKSNGISEMELGSKIEVDGSKPVTISQAMHVYAAQGNDLNVLALVHDNGFSAPVMDSIIAALPEKYKTAADQLVAEMSSHAPRLNIAVLDYSDGKKDLIPVSGAYVPMYRDMHTEGTSATVKGEIALQEDYHQTYVDQGLIRERVNRGENAKLPPLKLGLAEVYFQHIEDREHFIATARAVKDLNGLLRDKEISKAIGDKFGPEVKDALQDYVNRVATGTLAKGYRAHNNVVRMLDRFAKSSRQAAAFVHLGYNVVSALKAPVSIVMGLGHVDPLSMMHGIEKASRNWKETSEFAYKNDPQLAAAEYTKEQQEYKSPTKALEGNLPVTEENLKSGEGLLNAGKNAVHTVSSHSFDMIRTADQFTRVALWTGAYEHAKMDPHLSEADAIRYAQEVVLKTQPATNAKDLAGLYATNNEIFNMFLQFTHQLSQNYGILTHDLPRAWKSGNRQAVIGMGVGFVLNSLIEYGIANGRIPLDLDDLTQGMVQGLIATIPGIGPMINGIAAGFPPVPPAVDLAIVKPAKMLMAAKDGDITKVLDNAMYIGSAFGKLPYTQLRRTLTGAYDLLSGVDDDYRRLIWSNYQLHQKD